MYDFIASASGCDSGKILPLEGCDPGRKIDSTVAGSMGGGKCDALTLRRPRLNLDTHRAMDPSRMSPSSV